MARRSANASLVGGLSDSESQSKSASKASEHHLSEDPLNRQKAPPEDEQSKEAKVNVTKSLASAPKTNNDQMNSTKSTHAAERE